MKPEKTRSIKKYFTNNKLSDIHSANLYFYNFNTLNNYLCACCQSVKLFPFPATALTPDNVLKELKELDWNTLCNTNSPTFGTFDGILDLPVSEGRRIERIYVSEEERKSAGVLWWVDHHPLASWRLLITQLDWRGKHSLANRIHQYAEKVTGMFSSVLYCH